MKLQPGSERIFADDDTDPLDGSEAAGLATNIKTPHNLQQREGLRRLRPFAR
jgi:hypothetical protein